MLAVTLIVICTRGGSAMTSDEDAQREDRRLFVGNLPLTANVTALTALFSPFGELEEARVIIDRDTRQSKGCGFITFTTKEARP